LKPRRFEEIPMHLHAPPQDPCADAAIDRPRRRVIRIAVAGLAAPMAVVTRPAVAAAAGDRLVEEDAEGAPQPLRVADLKPGKPMLAYPFDTKAGKARTDTRLNKLVLIRLPEAEMTPETRARAAGGVLAYSAICTHQACDVKTWLAKEKALVCFCHSSKFALLDSGAVVGGPATRALPAVPLALEGDQIVIAGGFSAPPGGAAA
jgi:rieske iron-sulfur protein